MPSAIGLPLARERQDSAEDRADAGRGAEPERRPEERRRAGVARALDQARRCEAVEVRQRDQPHHREAEHDHHEAGDGEEELAVVEEEAPRGRDCGAERDEDRREAGDEGQARENDLAASHAGLLAGHHGEVAGHEREDARGREGDEAGDEGERDLGLHAAPQPS